MVVDSTQNKKSLYGHETQVGYGCAEFKSTPLMPASLTMLASRHHNTTAEIWARRMCRCRLSPPLLLPPLPPLPFFDEFKK